MMQTDLIIVSEYCQKCHIDPTFIFLLEEEGLIEIDWIEGEQYLPSTQLHNLEKYARMYYELSINIEGIEAIHHLLNRVESLQEELAQLRNRLRLYEDNELERPTIIDNIL